MLGVQCDHEEEGNVNTAAQALLLGDNQQDDAIDNPVIRSIISQDSNCCGKLF